MMGILYPIRILTFLAVCLLLSPTLIAQQPNNRQWKVEGVVVDSTTGKPLPQVRVELWMLHPLRTATALSRSDGRFFFDGIPAGSA
jgi:hypothetical protein